MVINEIEKKALLDLFKAVYTDEERMSQDRKANTESFKDRATMLKVKPTVLRKAYREWKDSIVKREEKELADEILSLIQ